MATTAFFSHKFTRNGKEFTMGCKVTLKDDSKISITNKWGARLNSDYYMLERAVKEGVANRFIHPGFTEVTDEQNDAQYTNLVKSLKEQTTEFKAEYLKKTEQWAWDDFCRMDRIKESDVIEERGAVWQGKKIHTKASYAYWNNIKSILAQGSKAYTEKKVQSAQLHYDHSIGKLAHRIIKKGLDFTNISIKTDYARFGKDGSLETIITDGKRTVRAWTILAWGPIKAPHYRYLIR